MPRLHYKCRCGLYNYTRNDWFAHFKYGSFWSALKFFLLTEIKLSED